jgi:hypothetical protein
VSVLALIFFIAGRPVFRLLLLLCFWGRPAKSPFLILYHIFFEMSICGFLSLEKFCAVSSLLLEICDENA